MSRLEKSSPQQWYCDELFLKCQAHSSERDLPVCIVASFLLLVETFVHLKQMPQVCLFKAVHIARDSYHQLVGWSTVVEFILPTFTSFCGDNAEANKGRRGPCVMFVLVILVWPFSHPPKQTNRGMAKFRTKILSQDKNVIPLRDIYCISEALFSGCLSVTAKLRQDHFYPCRERPLAEVKPLLLFWVMFLLLFLEATSDTWKNIKLKQEGSANDNFPRILLMSRKPTCTPVEYISLQSSVKNVIGLSIPHSELRGSHSQWKNLSATGSMSYNPSQLTCVAKCDPRARKVNLAKS